MRAKKLLCFLCLNIILCYTDHHIILKLSSLFCRVPLKQEKRNATKRKVEMNLVDFFPLVLFRFNFIAIQFPFRFVSPSSVSCFRGTLFCQYRISFWHPKRLMCNFQIFDDSFILYFATVIGVD